MAKCNSEKLPRSSSLAHILICESHELPIDIICEDCDKFICAKCAKTYHRDHDWKTLPTAAAQRRRDLHKFLKKIKEVDLPGIDAKISKQIKENKQMCDSEIKKLRKHCEEVMARLTEIKKRHEKTLRENLVKKNDQLSHVKSELDKKKKGIVKTVEFMEDNNSTMSDYSLIDKQRELTKMLSELEVHMANCEHSVRFTRGEIKYDILKYLVGRTLDLDDIEKVNQQGFKEHKFSIDPNDMCVTDNGDVYFTDFSNNSISCLSPSGSLSTVVSTDPLVPGGICHSVDGGLLLTLRDIDSDHYKLNSHSRRLVRHITVTGDVILEYEYQEDGQTRLFTLPGRVAQNRNSDICVLNSTSDTTGDLVIMSPSGRMKSAYRGQNLTEDFYPTAVVCDSLCNILVTDHNNKQIHLLSPDGEFLKFILTENEVNGPSIISLYKSTLWDFSL
ncbi:uncharacterized protein LOC133193013 [Saccostrea echinata]|uniref:uncharacterized protein LOC133193013 n=1 Tax=Saccostrea echinata TaxID=191078 RepID=UPI002A81C1D3|nr:uncharacterized protein LOC133193013 [Saccostrea echinata]